tara:strand:- start:647 stop:1774 length:1128 start_codon:yes stop_codon:yes gene_type:complete
MKKNNNLINIFVLAGDPSGDEYGAELMKQMKTENVNINFYGIGGPYMEQCGLKSMAAFEKMAVMGFIEILKSIRFFMALEKKIIDFVQEKKLEKIILIDYPGLNLRLCKKIKQKINCQIFYYISPQIWAWKEKRIETIKKYVDHMIVIFEFEKKWYAEKGLKTQFFGHPFLDIWDKNNNQHFIKKHNIDITKPIITLFPGSRIQELRKHLNVLIDASINIKKKIPDVQILLGLHPNINKPNIKESSIIIVHDSPLKALEIATFAVVASGTATLQAAIMNTPAIVVYKMNAWSWYLTNNLVKVKFASMANIIADKLVFPELLQKNLTSDSISELGLQLIHNTDYKNTMIDQIKKINHTIGEAGASRKIATFILGQN